MSNRLWPRSLLTEDLYLWRGMRRQDSEQARFQSCRSWARKATPVAHALPAGLELEGGPGGGGLEVFLP